MLPAPYLAALWAASAACAATVVGLRGGRLPDGKRLGAVALGAVVLGLVLWPWLRNDFGGQTDFLIETLLGEVPLDGTRSRTIVPPAMELLAFVLRWLPGDSPRVLLLPSVLAGGLAVFGFGLAVRSATGLLRPALVVAALVALDPQRLAWSHAAYHVIHPTACLAVAAALIAEGARRERDALAVAGGLWLGLAVVIRLDVATAAAPLAAWSLVLPGTPLRRAQRTTLMLLGAAIGAGPSIAPGLVEGAVATAGWHGSEVGPALVSGVGATELGWPWLHPVVLLVLAGLFAASDGAARRQVALLGLALALAWLALATFGDFGARHTLPLRGFLLVGVGMLLATTSLPRAARDGVPAVLVLAALVVTVPLRRDWCASPALKDEAPTWATPVEELTEPLATLAARDCAFVAQNDGYFAGWESADQLDLLDLLDPDLAAAAWRRHDGCIIWLRDDDDVRWDESVRLSRSTRLKRQWSWTRLGAGRTPFEGWYTAWALDGEGDAATPGRISYGLSRALGEGLGLVGGDRAACMAWAAGTCRWVDRCTDGSDPEFRRDDACMQILRSSCLVAPPSTARTSELGCDTLEVVDCADRDAARSCWDLAGRF